MSRHIPKPSWLKIKLPFGDTYTHVKHSLKEKGLHTVCEEAKCPNLGECWTSGTATFMLMGEICTRGCRFCAVKTRKRGTPLDPEEPKKVAKAVQEMGLDYVVLTSVDRDDLPDGGSSHFAETVEAIRKYNSPPPMIEILTPDFAGDRRALERVVASKPTVFAHNVETVPSLTPKVRDPRCSFELSLDVLRQVKELDPSIYTKSSIMLGLGESEAEVLETLRELRRAEVDIVTLGQYLQPTKKHLPVKEYITPDKFRSLGKKALEMGFLYVASGPLVRSSYRAAEFFIKNLLQKRAGKSEK